MSIFKGIPKPEPNPFGFEVAARNDDHPLRANMSVGEYHGNEGRPLVFQTIREVEELLTTKEGCEKYHNISNANKYSIPMDGKLNKMYGGFLGLKEFREASSRFMFGEKSRAVEEKRVVSIQCLSGSGCIRRGIEFLNIHFEKKKMYASNETFPLHRIVYEAVTKQKMESYRYFDRSTYSLDFEGMLEDFETKMEEGSIVLLHMCAHNPTGYDLSHPQWDQLISVMKKRKLIPFVDSAYAGFATGDPEYDSYCVRKMVDEKMEIICCQSFSKGFGIYGERTGCLHVVTNDIESCPGILSSLENIGVKLCYFVPTHGARLVTYILETPSLRKKWRKELKEAALRLVEMRKRLYLELEKRRIPGLKFWKGLESGKGMFFLSNLKPEMCRTLGSKFHVYITPAGRFAIPGLNPKNIENVANGIDWVIRNCEQ